MKNLKNTVNPDWILLDNTLSSQKDNKLIKENRKTILSLLQKNIKNFKYQKNGSLNISSGNVDLSIIYTSNPENAYRFDNNIYFILKIIVDSKEFVYSSYKYLSYKYFTKSSCNSIGTKFKNGNYNEFINKLLRKAYLELKICIFTDFEPI